MRWYVKYEGTDEISGPMTKEQALDKSSRAEGMIFSENIFSPKIMVSSEVESLIKDLKGVRDRVEDHVSGRVVGIVSRAIDTIVLLSREKVVEASVESGVFELDGEMPVGVKLIVRDYDVECCDEERVVKDAAGRNCVESRYGE